MKSYLILWASIVGVVCVLPLAAMDVSANKKKECILPLSKSNSPGELAKRLNVVVSSTSTPELTRRVSAADCTVALAAGWERVRRAMLKSGPQQLASPDREAISRFLGVVEGRTRLPLPAIWETSMKSVKYYNRETLLFPLPKTIEIFTNTHAALGVAFKRAGDQWIITKANQTISLAVDERFGPIDKATIELDEKTAYVALYAWRPIPHKLYSVDRNSGKVNWTSDVWAAGDFVIFQGRGWHVVEIRVADADVGVFGVSDGTAYLEVFDRQTGENRCRFSTAYFGLDQQKIKVQGAVRKRDEQAE